MKKISEHLGQIIVALAGIALLISAVVVFRAPIGDFFANIVGKETTVSSQLMEGIENPGLSDLTGGSGSSGEDEASLVPGLYATGTTNLIYSWDELVSNGYLTLSGTTVTDYSDPEPGDLVFPDAITYIGEAAFHECSGLSGAIFSKNSQLTEIGPGGFNKSGLTRITFPASVTKIGDGSFSHSANLISISFEEGSQLTLIGAQAFFDLPITSFIVPSSVTNIAGRAFADCTNLTSITFENPYGWYYSQYTDYANGTSINVDDSEANATNLMGDYRIYYLYREG